ncbi:unnamed protein product [Mytilus coruscus]|uniref:Uncharacterized protein n=1 Tax=Mytilus coruscus TaxID=42192 RepID=A0A6J8EGJ2_MYTCO|nr:unnamed protein product [Mytilus coruscus]
MEQNLNSSIVDNTDIYNTEKVISVLDSLNSRIDNLERKFEDGLSEKIADAVRMVVHEEFGKEISNFKKEINKDIVNIKSDLDKVSKSYAEVAKPAEINKKCNIVIKNLTPCTIEINDSSATVNTVNKLFRDGLTLTDIKDSQAKRLTPKGNALLKVEVFKLWNRLKCDNTSIICKKVHTWAIRKKSSWDYRVLQLARKYKLIESVEDDINLSILWDSIQTFEKESWYQEIWKDNYNVSDKWNTSDQHGPKWDTWEQHGPKYDTWDQHGSKWDTWDQHGPKWDTLDHDGSKWDTWDQHGPKCDTWDQHGSK